MEGEEFVGTIEDTSNVPDEEDGSGMFSDSFAITTGVVVLGVMALYVAWKKSGFRGIKERLTEYQQTKTEYAHQIKVNEEKQVELMANLNENHKLSKEKEKEIANIIDEAAEKIRATLQTDNPTAIVKRLRKSDLN